MGFAKDNGYRGARGGETSARQPFVLALAAFFVSLILAFGLAAAPAPASAAEADSQTQAALEQLEQAFADAYAASQADGDIAADQASSLKAAPDAASGEFIADDETPLAAYDAQDADPSSSAVEEEILDDENPLAASPYAAPVFNFVWVLLVVIVAVAGFFLVSTRRLDKNINQMRHFVD